MNGIINLHRFSTITLAHGEKGWYVVFSDGRHRLGYSVDSEKAGESLIASIQLSMSNDCYAFRIKGDIEEVRSYKPCFKKEEKQCQKED